MFNNIGGCSWLIIIVLILLLFGGCDFGCNNNCGCGCPNPCNTCGC